MTRDQLGAVPATQATDTWFPTPHHQVLDAAIETLNAAGFAVARTQLALSRNDNRFFGTLDPRLPTWR